LKVKDHREIHGLPYIETSKAATKILRTEENIEDFMNSIEILVFWLNH